MVRDLAAVVVIAIGNHRIPVITAAHDPVQLVAASRPHFDAPELTVEVEGNAERVAVTHRPELPVHTDVVDQRIVVDVVHEGIVLGDAAILMDAEYLAHVRLHVLRGREFLALTRRDPQVTVRAQQQAMPVMAVAHDFGILAPDDIGVGQVTAAIRLVEHCPHYCGTASVADATLGVAEIDNAVVGKVRVHEDVAQPALATVVDIGHAADRARLLAILRDDKQGALLLRNQHAAVGKKRQGPGLIESSDQVWQCLHHFIAL